MFSDRKRRKGFTLIEMLIVLVIISILAGMMMMTLASTSDKAKATAIVSNMRIIKAALLMYYADHGSWPGDLGTGKFKESSSNTKASSLLLGYIDKAIPDEYTIVQNPTKTSKYYGSIFVKYNGLNKLSSGIRSQLAIMAPTANLWNTSEWVTTINKDTKNIYGEYYYTEGNSKSGLNTIHMPVYLTAQ